MEELLMNVDWTAVVVGAVAAYALGWLWYSPTLFGTKWAADNGLTTDGEKGSMLQPMLAQAVGTFLLAWVIGITATTDSLAFAILIVLTIATLMKAGGLFLKKTKYVIMVDAGYVFAMAVVMILVHAVL